MSTVIEVSRRLRDLLEPFVGQVYFSPECHAGYAALGFSPSPGAADGVALPDGPAYFTSRGSVMGQVPGDVVASAFAVFNPAVVVPAVAYGWSLTDAATICRARSDGAITQLARILGPEPEGADEAAKILRRATEGLRPEGRPLYSGVRAQGPPADAADAPGSPLGELWWLGDLLREFRGDSHTIAWVGAGFDAVEIGLLTELWWGLPVASYIRTRAWSDTQINDAIERLRSAGMVTGSDPVQFTDKGSAVRGAVEDATDGQLGGVVDAIGDDRDQLFELLRGWSLAVVDAAGYLRAGAASLTG